MSTSEEHKRLLTARVLPADAQRKTEENLAAMTLAIAELIRRVPLPPGV